MPWLHCTEDQCEQIGLYFLGNSCEHFSLIVLTYSSLKQHMSNQIPARI